MTLQTPDQARTDEASITVRGTVADTHGIASLQILPDAGGVRTLEPSSPWETTLELDAGANDFEVVVTDRAGLVTRTSFTATRSRPIHLRPPEPGSGAARLELDRAALEAFLSVADQRALELVSLELRPAIVAALRAIRDPVAYDIDTSGWTQPEWNLYRLLNMTPDTADLRGSAVEDLLDLGSAIGLPSPRLLAELLDIDLTAPFVDIEIAAQVLLERLVATHPNVGLDPDTGEPVVSITMYDVLEDLAPLAQRLGPAGDHPGILTGQTRAQVLEPGFLMTLEANSNLTQYDAIDASAGRKDYLFALEGEQVLTFDFLDEQTFTVVGLVAEPAVDLQVALQEHPDFLAAGGAREARPDPERPGFARGDGAFWDIAPWYLDATIAETAYRQYHDRFASMDYQRTLRYDVSSIEDAAVLGWERGWVQIMTSADIGNPPPPLYIWDLLMEIAQIRLHDGGIPEGDADVSFLLEALPVGLEADELIEALRPSLQDQEAELSELLLGSRGLATSGADLFYVPGTDAGYLLFVAPEDAPGAPYGWQNPGFFADAALTQKVSTRQPLPGVDDDTHEKVLAAAGDVHYIQDDQAQTYRLRVLSADPQGARIVVEPVAPEASP